MRRTAIERLLPVAYQQASVDGSVLATLIEVMEDLHAPDEEILGAVDDLFTAYRSIDTFVPFMSRWIAMDHVIASSRIDAALPLPIGRLRDLVAEGAALAQWRGTPYGITRVLQIATGLTGIVVEEPEDRPFHIVVRVPAEGADQIDFIGRLTRAEKPAATTCEVILAV